MTRNVTLRMLGFSGAILLVTSSCTEKVTNEIQSSENTQRSALSTASSPGLQPTTVIKVTETPTGDPSVDCEAVARRPIKNPNILGLSLSMDFTELHSRMVCLDPNEVENPNFVRANGEAADFATPLKNVTFETKDGTIIAAMAGIPGQERAWGLSRVVRFPDSESPTMASLINDLKQKYGLTGEINRQGNYIAKIANLGVAVRKYSALSCPQIEVQGVPTGRMNEEGAECGLYVEALINSVTSNWDLAKDLSVIITNGEIFDRLNQQYESWVATKIAERRRGEISKAERVKRPTL